MVDWSLNHWESDWIMAFKDVEFSQQKELWIYKGVEWL
jgi:hypothetical protein